MKTIYNVKALCVVALLGTTATMSAQEDNSDVLNKITDRMQQLIELTKQEA